MRKLYCSNCKQVFSEDEAESRNENVGEFWGAPAYLEVNVCPFCRSDEIDEYEGGDEE